jgi:predicted lipoprotein with Yx(FWY)xxD motif
MKTSLVSFTFVLATAFATAAFAQAAMPAKTATTSKGEAFVDAKGMSLYTFDKDMAGKSACNDKCAANWPPLMAGADAKDAGEWSVIKRDDGSIQWAYKGKPLYTFVKDAKAGDANGDGFLNGAWHLAKP